MQIYREMCARTHTGGRDRAIEQARDETRARASEREKAKESARASLREHEQVYRAQSTEHRAYSALYALCEFSRASSREREQEHTT